MTSAQMQDMLDLIREERIAHMRSELETCMPSERPVFWERMRREILARSPQQVARMEHAMGLA